MERMMLALSNLTAVDMSLFNAVASGEDSNMKTTLRLNLGDIKIIAHEEVPSMTVRFKMDGINTSVSNIDPIAKVSYN